MKKPITAASSEIVEAQEVSRIMAMDGGKILVNWIKTRMDMIHSNLISGESDITIGSIEKRAVDKTELTIINVVKDGAKNELRTLKLLLSKIADWEKLARESGRR